MSTSNAAQGVESVARSLTRQLPTDSVIRDLCIRLVDSALDNDAWNALRLAILAELVDEPRLLPDPVEDGTR